MKTILRWLTVGLVMVVLSGCGGNNDTDSDPETAPTQPTSKILYGRFARVSGVSYTTSSGIMGITGDDGEFEYQDGDDVTFSIAEAELGTVKAKEEVDVFDFRKPEFVSQILYSLDADKDDSNGFDFNYLNNLEQQKKIFSIKEHSSEEKIIIDEISSYDRQYKNFLEKHYANIFPLNKIILQEVSEALSGSLSRKTKDYLAKEIFLGNSIHLLGSNENFSKKIRELYIKGDFDYRVTVAALSRLYLTISQELNERFHEDIRRAEERQAAVEKFDRLINGTLDVAANTLNALVSDKGEKLRSFICSNGKTSIDLGSDYFDSELNQGVKLATTVISDCKGLCDGKGDLQSCAVDSMKNSMDLFVEKMYEENDPMFQTAKTGISVIADTTKAWVSCTKFENLKLLKVGEIKNAFKDTLGDATKCATDLSKAMINNTYKLVTTSSLLALIVGDSFDKNAAVLALEYLMAEQYLDLSKAPCEIIDYYDGKPKTKERCETNWKNIVNPTNPVVQFFHWYDKEGSEKAQRTSMYANIIAAIASSGKANITSIFALPDYNMESFDNYLQEYRKIFNQYKNIYSKKFRKYLGKNGKIDQAKLYSASYFDIKTIIKNPEVSPSYNGYDVSVCIDVDSPITATLENVELKLIQDAGVQSLNLNDQIKNKNFRGKLSNICGTFNDIEWENHDNKMLFLQIKYKRYHGLSQKIYERNSYRLFTKRSKIDCSETVDLFGQLSKDFKSISLNADFKPCNSNGEFFYSWGINIEGCQTYFDLTKNDVFLFDIPEQCQEKPINISVSVSNDRGELAKNTKIIDPLIDIAGSIISLRNNGIIMQHMEPYEYSPEITGGIPSYTINIDDLSGEIEVIRSDTRANTFLLKATNYNKKVVNAKLNLSVIDSDKNIRSFIINANIHPAKDTTNKTIGWIKNDAIPYSLEYTEKAPNDVFSQQWGIINTSGVTLHNVTIRYNKERSSSSLNVDKYILVKSEIDPGEIWKPRVKITVPKTVKQKKNFGYFDITFIDDDGKEKPLRFSKSGSYASLSYRISVDDIDYYSPVVDKINVMTNSSLLYGSFEIRQKNKKVKHLRVHFSPYSYFPESDREFVDVDEGSYDEVQGAGTKHFSFDASQWAGKTVYWKIEAANKDGVTVSNPPKGSILIPDDNPTKPAKPILSNPSNGATVSDITPTLRWSDVKGSTYYQLTLGVVNGGTSGIVYRDIRVNSTQKTTKPLIKGKQYAWGVKACNSVGCSNMSATSKFTVETSVSKPVVSSFDARDTGSQGDGKVRVTYSISTNTSLSRVRTHCGVGSSYNYAKYADSSTSSRNINVTLQDSRWAGQTVYCKAEVINTNNQKADVKQDSVRLSAASSKPVVSNLVVKQWKSGYKYVSVKFDLSDRDSSEMGTLKVHCATNTSYSSNYKAKDISDKSTGSKSVILSYDPNWNHKRVYCKIEAVDLQRNKANVREDSVYLSY